jgi:hypothetical protein
MKKKGCEKGKVNENVIIREELKFDRFSTVSGRNAKVIGGMIGLI